MTDLRKCPLCKEMPIACTSGNLWKWFWYECKSCELKGQAWMSEAWAIQSWNRRRFTHIKENRTDVPSVYFNWGGDPTPEQVKKLDVAIKKTLEMRTNPRILYRD